jgi:hypothetical protein
MDEFIRADEKIAPKKTDEIKKLIFSEENSITGEHGFIRVHL